MQIKEEEEKDKELNVRKEWFCSRWLLRLGTACVCPTDYQLQNKYLYTLLRLSGPEQTSVRALESTGSSAELGLSWSGTFWSMTEKWVHDLKHTLTINIRLMCFSARSRPESVLRERVNSELDSWWRLVRDRRTLILSDCTGLQHDPHQWFRPLYCV